MLLLLIISSSSSSSSSSSHQSSSHHQSSLPHNNNNNNRPHSLPLPSTKISTRRKHTRPPQPLFFSLLRTLFLFFLLQPCVSSASRHTNRSLFLSLPPLIIVVLSPLLRISCSLVSSFLASAYQSCCVYLPPVCATNMFRAWMDPELADHNCWSAARRSNRAVAAGCLFALNPHPPPLSFSLSVSLPFPRPPPTSLLFSLVCQCLVLPSVGSLVHSSIISSVRRLARSPVQNFFIPSVSLVLQSINFDSPSIRCFSRP